MPEVSGSMDNVVLFPKTLDYYEQELTRYLQTEQYGEAKELISFLLRFQNLNPRQTEQWAALQQWLETTFTETQTWVGQPSTLEEDESEEELLRHYVAERSAYLAEYPDKLLTLLSEGSMEQQTVALEQLAFIEHPDVSKALHDWLSSEAQQPHIQFKALQILKQRGEKGSILIPRGSEQIFVEVEDTPLGPEQFPAIVQEMIRRVGEISETDSPDFHFFAEQTWNDFLSYIYGTRIYVDLIKQEEGHVDLWASALHVVLQEILFGHADRLELMELYGITEQMQLPWKQAYTTIRRFTDALLSLHE
jgi:hypothetical protein